MAQEPRSLPWVTPARYVGPALLVILVAAGALAGWLAIDGRLNEAIVTLLFTICMLLIGLADLLGELVMLAERRLHTPEA